MFLFSAMLIETTCNTIQIDIVQNNFICEEHVNVTNKAILNVFTFMAINIVRSGLGSNQICRSRQNIMSNSFTKSSLLYY